MHEVDMPANKRWCCNKRHGEDKEGADAMAMTEEDAAGIGMVVAGWEDEDNETRETTMWDNKSWEQRIGSGATRGRGVR